MCGINFLVELPVLLGIDDDLPQRGEPLLHDLRNAVTHWSWPAIELGGRGREKAATTKYLVADISEPDVTELPEARQSTLSFECWSDNCVDENRASGFNCRELQVFFGAEVSKLCRELRTDPGRRRIADQLLDCASSVGANYRSAAVVGYDNNDIGVAVTPPLTTIDNRFFELGASMGRGLLSIMAGKQASVRQTLQPILVERNSHRT